MVRTYIRLLVSTYVLSLSTCLLLSHFFLLIFSSAHSCCHSSFFLLSFLSYLLINFFLSSYPLYISFSIFFLLLLFATPLFLHSIHYFSFLTLFSSFISLLLFSLFPIFTCLLYSYTLFLFLKLC